MSRPQLNKKITPVKLLYLGFILCLLASFIVMGCSKEETSTSQTTTTSKTTTTTSQGTTTTSATTTGTTTKTTSTTTSKTTTTTSTTTPTGIKTGGVLRIGMPMDAMILGDPQETRKPGFIMQKAAIESLARFDGNGLLQPYLAESWTENPANLSFAVKLKKGIKFHDGTDFNAQAVKYNWDRFIAAKSSYTQSVASVEVVDDYTVVAWMKTWNNACPYNLCFWAGGIASPTAWQTNGEAWGKLNPVGTGPFKFVSWVPESKIVFEKFDDYWQEGKPYLDGIEFHIIADESTRSAAFEAGEIDMIDQATFVQTHTLAGDNKYTVVELRNGVGTGIDMLTFDAGKPSSLFADLKVRQAIAYAIDKKSIVDSTFYGYAVPTDQFGTPTNWGYNPNLTTYPFDPDKARALLAEAGHTSIQTTLTCLSEETQFTAIAGMLNDIGIDTKVKLVPGGQWYQLATQGWEGLLHMPSPPDGDISTRFSFTTTTSLMGVSQLRPKENDKLVAEITSTPKFDQKKALTQAYQQRIFGDLVSAIGLWITDDLAVKYPYVKDDNFCVFSGHEWTPQDAWLDK